MHRHEVRRGQQRFEAGHLYVLCRVRSGGRRHVRVVREDAHPEARGDPCHGTPYRAETDDPQRCPGELAPPEADVGVGGDFPLSLAYVPLPNARVAGEREHLRDGELGDGLRVPRGRAHDSDAPLRRGVEVGVVQIAAAGGRDAQSGSGVE